MMLFARIVFAVFALGGAAGWIALILRLRQLGHAFAGMSAGPVAGPTLAETLFEAAVWLFPMMMFVFMLLSSLNLLKGIPRRAAYWYVQIILVATALVLVLLCRGFALKLAGLVLMLLAVLWRYIFRNMPEALGTNPDMPG